MPVLLRVLLVEDSEDDAKLILQALRRGAWEVACERVDTAGAMSVALDKKCWDLIIADYSMPSFSGPAALALAIERMNDVPFILVSGAVSEELAVQAMKAGADDYVSKDNLTRLVTAVERELLQADGRRKTRHIAKQLRIREAQLANALKFAHVGTWHLDIGADTAVWSVEACRIIGFTTERVTPTFEDLLARMIPEHRTLLANLLRHPDTKQFAQDCQMIRADGATQFIHICGEITRDAGQEPREAAGIIQEITEQKRAERALEISEVRHRRLFESSHDGIMLLDAVTAKVLDVNRFMVDLLGYSREHFLGKELWEIGVFRDIESSKSAMATLQRVGESRYEDLPLLHSDGRYIPVEFVSNAYREGSREVIQCNIRDISERKRVAGELAKAKEDSEAANRSKSEFLANMSHEIRTPMTAILGFAEMLLHKSAEQCKEIGCVQIIRRNALHLLELINEILDLSKIEAGQMTVERIPCHLPAILSDIFSLMRPRAVEKGLMFEATFQGPIPAVIQSDPTRLRQILVNLLGNAMKFTEAGKIGIRISNEVAASNMLVRVDVVDTGIGMSPDQLLRLFRPFAQGDTSITRKFGGTGLGLTISQRLAKLLGGDITVASESGTGSTFTLRIDGGASAGVEQLVGLTEATLPSRLDEGVRADIHLQGRILLVEDGRDNQRLLRMLLTDAGLEVVSAENGQIGVDLATTQPFDLILMDMQMPVMDGHAATRELRRMGLTLPIVALTAHAMAEDRAKCIACGCTAYLSKPIDEAMLLETVSQHLENGLLAPKAGAEVPTNVSPSPEKGCTDRITSSFSGDRRMMKIIPEFVDGLAGEVHKMTDFLARNELVLLQRVIHQLLGVCGGYGFDAVTDPAFRAEDSIRMGKGLETITTEINSLIEVIRRIAGYDESRAADKEPVN